MNDIKIATFTLFMLLFSLCMTQETRGDINIERPLYKGSYALIIGISDYLQGWPDLPSVIEETKDIKTALIEKGFIVRRVINPDNNELETAIDDFIDTYGYESDNQLLIFFSGHGYSRKKGVKGYLVPSNAPDPRKDEIGFLKKALPMSQIIAWCRQIEARHTLFVFDSCFSGTIFKTKALDDIPEHISAKTSKPVRQFITAGDAGEKVPAKSAFAPLFIRGIHGEADLSKDGFVTGSELGTYLQDKLIYYQTYQTPQYGKIRDPELDRGDFVFVVGNKKNLPVKRNIGQAVMSASKDGWVIVRENQRHGNFTYYLSQALLKIEESDKNDDGTISCVEAFSYTKKAIGNRQNPHFDYIKKGDKIILSTKSQIRGRLKKKSYALIIGASSNKEKPQPSGFSERNAKLFSEALTNSDTGTFKTENVILLSSNQIDNAKKPTRTNVLKALESFSRLLTKDSRFLFYFSGAFFQSRHKDESYLFLHDTDIENYQTTGLGGRDLMKFLDSIKSSSKVVISEGPSFHYLHNYR